MFDWIIIGGGIQGCTLAVSLIKAGKVSTDKLLIIDPHNEPLAQWKRNTKRLEMKYLRSPFVHHLDLDPFSLQRFARKANISQAFYGFYKRPSLNLFHAHSETLFQESGLRSSWHQGTVAHLERRKDDKWLVMTGTNSIFITKNVAIATGFTNALHYPEWSKVIRKNHPDLISHIYEEEVPEIPHEYEPIVIVGAGITAAHLSIKLSNLHKKVILITRHPLRVKDFDSDPGWLGPKKMNSFLKIKDYKQRRQAITEARYRGSFPKELSLELSRLLKKNKLSIIHGEIKTCFNCGESSVQLITDSEQKIETSRVILATGFEGNMKHLSWLQNVIKREKLLCADCGFPIVSKNLEWMKNLYVIGALAELEVGPTARNISGARTAASKIINSI